jgi:hypothetical protein
MQKSLDSLGTWDVYYDLPKRRYGRTPGSASKSSRELARGTSLCVSRYSPPRRVRYSRSERAAALRGDGAAIPIKPPCEHAGRLSDD